MWIRIGKTLLVAIAATYATLVAMNNIADYGSNFQFVRHVLMMDTTFPGNQLMWRAIESSSLHHVAYVMIITTEAMIAALGWTGVFSLWSARHDAGKFNAKKTPATLGLMLGIGLWFGGFIVIGGEWFLMWQSNVWNGTEASFRVAALFALILIVLTLEDRESMRE